MAGAVFWDDFAMGRHRILFGNTKRAEFRVDDEIQVVNWDGESSFQGHIGMEQGGC